MDTVQTSSRVHNNKSINLQYPSGYKVTDSSARELMEGLYHVASRVFLYIWVPVLYSYGLIQFLSISKDRLLWLTTPPLVKFVQMVTKYNLPMIYGDVIVHSVSIIVYCNTGNFASVNEIWAIANFLKFAQAIIVLRKIADPQYESCNGTVMP